MTCDHGRAGYCHDEATPEQRLALAGAHTFAYAWAVGVGIEPDEAEAFAAWYAQRAYSLDVEEWGWTPREHEAYEIELGRRRAA